MSTRCGLLMVDPNKGFLVNRNYTPSLPGGNMNLYIPGGEVSAGNMAKLILQGKDAWVKIKATLDSHHPAHIASPMWWVDKAGRHPAPFTPITLAEVLAGEWRAAKIGLQAKSVEYITELEKRGRYTHLIWPPHCIIATEGADVEDQIREALLPWEAKFGIVEWKTKGSYPFREHFSGLEAEVPDSNAPDTLLDVDFIRAIEDPNVDEWFMAGWALSHCFKFTVESITKNAANIASLAKKLTILSDCTLSVPGFEAQGEQFLNDMRKLGIKIAKSTEVL